MELRQLRYFEAVARCGGFTRAAEQLHVAQSAVSAQIRALAQLLTALDASEVDLVLGPIHADLPSRYSALPICEEELVVVTALGHRLAGRRGLVLADLQDEPFVCLPGRSGPRGLLDSAAAAEGFQPQIRLETHSPTSIRGLVSAGLGVALLARSTAESPGPPIAVHRLPALPPHPPIGLIHHRDHRLSPAAQACRRLLADRSTITRTSTADD